MVARRAHNPK
ncbi:hypothetical protein D039_4896, partial [Vibrio parahaemolyticus EKP-028]